MWMYLKATPETRCFLVSHHRKVKEIQPKYQEEKRINVVMSLYSVYMSKSGFSCVTATHVDAKSHRNAHLQP